MRAFHVLAILVSVAAASCGSDSASSHKQYQFTENGCDTKVHAFETDQAYCEGLRSNTLNQGCAYDLRKQAYEQDCGGGTFTTTN